MAFKFLMVLSVLFLIALCVDGAYSKKLPSCDCLSKAVDRCGTGASIRARRCRNKSLRRCVRKTVKRTETTIHRRTIVSTRPPRRTLVTYCNRVARRRCGTDGTPACIAQVKKEVKQREIKFRTTVLKACACRSKLSVRCRTRLVGKRCSRRCVRKYNRCARRCLRRGCKIRAKLECVSHNNKTKCRRSVLKSCRRVNNVTIKRSFTVSHRTIVVRKINLDRHWRSICQRIAVRKCGPGDQNKKCRANVRTIVQEKEKTFRQTALEQCACRTKLSKRCTKKPNSRRCVRRLNRCKRRCLRRACRSRAKVACANKNKGRRCRRVATRRCRRFHFKKVKKVRRNRKLRLIRKRLNKRKLRAHCRRVARRRCRKVARKLRRSCRARVIKQVKRRELEFRRTTLKACACKSRLSVRCRTRLTGRNCSRRCVRKYNKCSRRCLRKAIKVRVARECAGKKKVRRCRRLRTRRYTRLHCRRVRRVRKTRKGGRKLRLIRRKCNRRRLRSYCKRVARRRCRKVARKLRRSCRRRVVREVKRREGKFRTTALKACACKSRLSVRCRTRLTGRNCSRRCVRKYNRCSRRCLRKAIKVRVARECAGKKKVRRCRRLRTRRYTRLHCRRVRRIRKTRKGGRKHRKSNKKTHKVIKPFVHPAVVIPAQPTPVHTTPAQPTPVTQPVTTRVKEVKATIKTYNQLPTGVLESHCKSVAIAKCGEGEAFRDCRRRVREETRNKEIVFRMSTIKSCKCDAESDSHMGQSCANVAFDCVNKCFDHSCKLRSTLICEHNKDQSACYTTQLEQCTRLHKNFDN